MLKQYFLLSLLSVTFIIPKSLNAQVLHSPKALHEDLYQLKQALIDYHPDLFAHQSKESFDLGFNGVAHHLDQNMTENEFFRLVKPLIAKVKCGHTELYHSPNYAYQLKQWRFPLTVEIVNEEQIRVITSAITQIPCGANITSIDSIPVSTIIPSLLKYISSDGQHNNGRYYWLGKQFFSLYADVLATNIAIDINYSYNGNNYAVQVLPKLAGNQKQVMHSLISAKIYQNEKSTDATLRISSFDKALLKQQGIHFKKFLARFFEDVSKKQVDKLTIDLRNNTGGNDLLAIELYKYISKQPFKFYEKLTLHAKSKKHLGFPHRFFFRIQKTDSLGMMEYVGHKGLKWMSPAKNFFDGEVEVLVNGSTMSAATHFAAKCHNNKRAIIGGQISAGKYSSSNSGFLIYQSLKHSGLQLFVPAIHYNLYLPNKDLITEAIIPNDFVSNKPIIQQ